MDPPGFFPLIVRGGQGINATHDGSALTLRFNKSSVAAGDPSTFGRMPLGSAAWVDRPLNAAEPSVLKQQMNRDDAASIAGVLRNNERFWKFLCSNTNRGFFEVFRSEPTGKQVILDDQ
jgi:hypothetical protein